DAQELHCPARDARHTLAHVLRPRAGDGDLHAVSAFVRLTRHLRLLREAPNGGAARTGGAAVLRMGARCVRHASLPGVPPPVGQRPEPRRAAPMRPCGYAGVVRGEAASSAATPTHWTSDPT